MAKDNERRVARIYYVEQGMTAKEISERLGVTENTVGNWVKDGGWKDLRDARVASPDMLITSLKELLQTLTQKRLEAEQEDAEPNVKVKLSDEIAKVSKALEAAKKEGSIPLATYLRVMEEVFDDMRQRLPKIYVTLLDFQHDHIERIAQKYQ